MADNLTPATTLALMQATQPDAGKLDKILKSAKDAKNLEKVEEAAREFEAVFVAEMMKPMFEGIKTDGMFGGGKGEEIFRGQMLQEYGKMVSQTGQLGIAEHVKAELLRIQESTNDEK